MNEQELNETFQAMSRTTWPAPDGLVDRALTDLPQRRRPPMHPATRRRIRVLAIAGSIAGAALAVRRLSKRGSQ